MPIGYVYILECTDGTFYTGSTVDLDKRIEQHQNGRGANHTKKRLSVTLVYFEKFTGINEAFSREKQIQGWTRKKKVALIEENYKDLSKHSECMNASNYKKWLLLRSATKKNNE